MIQSCSDVFHHLTLVRFVVFFFCESELRPLFQVVPAHLWSPWGDPYPGACGPDGPSRSPCGCNQYGESEEPWNSPTRSQQPEICWKPGTERWESGHWKTYSWRSGFFHLQSLIVISVVQLQHLMLRRFFGQNRTQTGLITKIQTNGCLVVSHFIMPVLHWHMWPWSTKPVIRVFFLNGDK